MSSTKRLSNERVFAHDSTDGRKQLVSEHLLQVSRRSRQLAAKLNLPHAGELIRLLHDLGKATVTFQDYLLSYDKTT